MNQIEKDAKVQVLADLYESTKKALTAWLKAEHDDAKEWDVYRERMGVWKAQLNEILEELENDA